MYTKPSTPTNLPALLLDAATPRQQGKVIPRYSIHDVRVVFALIVQRAHPQLGADDRFGTVDLMHDALARTVPGSLIEWLRTARPADIREHLHQAAARLTLAR